MVERGNTRGQRCGPNARGSGRGVEGWLLALVLALVLACAQSGIDEPEDLGSRPGADAVAGADQGGDLPTGDTVDTADDAQTDAAQDQGGGDDGPPLALMAVEDSGCVQCHTDKERLKVLAPPEPEPEGGSGAG